MKSSTQLPQRMTTTPVASELPEASVVLVEDHPGYRLGIAYALEQCPALTLVGIFGDGEQGLDGIRRLRPTVALVDIILPSMDGLAVLDAIVSDGIPTSVVLLTAVTDMTIVRSALEAGAAGYLSKADDPTDICDAVVAAARGIMVTSRSLLGGFVAFPAVSRLRPMQQVLSNRETDVLRLVAEGHPVHEIGRRLYLSPSTVKTHLAHIYEKLGVHCRSAAVAQAMRSGILEDVVTPANAQSPLSISPSPLLACVDVIPSHGRASSSC